MEFTEFHNWVYKEIGLSLNPYKPTQLKPYGESRCKNSGGIY